ncbi:MAG TPA: selenium metabolism-associated LysR family transcriptional regulator [Candidatus Limnocylindrales bacterium]|nr:selenium metabolism-associated LysR family transcriptional regulator [Candidatus Limnocylindrales bacterium]
MDFDQIRIFLKVASLKSFSEAGEKLYISQPSVSTKIKTLEEELGVVLFDRSRSRELSLTEDGRIFLDYAQALVNLQEECREKLSRQYEKASGSVNIGASTVPGIYLLPSLLALFRQRCAPLEYNITILATNAVLEGVLNYSYDLGFVGLIKRDERLIYIPLLEDELVLCTPKKLFPDNAFPNGVPVEVCFSQYLLMRETGSATRQLFEKALANQALTVDRFKGVACFNSLEGIKQAVKHGLGVAVVSKLSVQDMVEAQTVDVYNIEALDLRRSLYLVYDHRRILSGAARRLKSYVIAELGALDSQVE